MLHTIIKNSLRHRFIVLSSAALLLGVGCYQFSKAKYDIFPNFSIPSIVVQTEAVGYASEQVEKLVTTPLENAIQGISSVDHLHSSSIQGLSVITIFFKEKSDMHQNRSVVAERLSNASTVLPDGVRPVINPETTSTSIISIIGLTSIESKSLMDLRDVADWTIKPRLQAIPGVAKVTVFGGEVRQLQIQFHQNQLVKYDLAIPDVIVAAKRTTGVLSGGFVDNPNQRIILQEGNQPITPEILKNAVLSVPAQNGKTVSVSMGDIAEIVYAPEPVLGAATIMGKPAIQFIISGALDSNAYEVSEHITDTIRELQPEVKKLGYEFHSDIFSQSEFINHAVKDFRFSFVIGISLVILILVLFLSDFRLAAISCTVIPLSLLTAVMILTSFGFTLNMMTLGGLAIAIGEVVDDAVIDVENIVRRLRENALISKPLPTIRVILKASVEVRSAVVYATLAMSVAFLPVMMMSGVAGRMFYPLGLAYVLSNLASLGVAITITPVLCYFLLVAKSEEIKSSRFSEWLKVKYRRSLERIHDYSHMMVYGFIFFLCAALICLQGLGGDFLPELHEGHYIVHMSLLPGTSLDESLRIGNRVTSDLMTLPFIQKVAQRTGRAEGSDDVLGTHYSEFEVQFKTHSDVDEEVAVAQIRSCLGKYPGAHFSVKTFLTERIEETLSNSKAAVIIKIYGNSLDSLDRVASEISNVLRRTSGSEDVQIEASLGSPSFLVEPDFAKISEWGFAKADVAEAINVAFEGIPVGRIYQDGRQQTVSVILDPSERHSKNDIENLPLRSSLGSYVRLKDLAEIKQVTGRYEIVHEAASRVQTVTCNVKGGNVNGFVQTIQNKIGGSIQLPPGIYLRFEGEAEARKSAQKDLLVYSIVAGIGVMLIISLVVKDKRNIILILPNLPFSLVGGVIGAVVSGPISIGSLVGFITVFGISARTSMMMVSHYEHLVNREKERWSKEIAFRGAVERLAPILMTALVTGLALLPIALMYELPGFEIEGPMAWVVLGGLFTSTVLNLFVLPTLALKFGRFSEADSIQ